MFIILLGLFIVLFSHQQYFHTKIILLFLLIDTFLIKMLKAIINNMHFHIFLKPNVYLRSNDLNKSTTLSHVNCSYYIYQDI